MNQNILEKVATTRVLRVCLEKHFGCDSWNFDLEDFDKILRVETEEELKRMIVILVEDHGFHCEELA